MTIPPYSDSDVDLVAAVLWQQTGTTPTAPSEWCRIEARAVLDALAAAGRLTAEALPCPPAPVPPADTARRADR
ncbi:hypothetical protein [Micromonospora fluostatini]|uniref:hypothetical protein n=1 Tax=Micromonospora sp. JCM 30529 TaxID=3421643 RepID=UPI003D1684A8